MLTFFVRLLFFLILARVAFVVLRALGLIASRTLPRSPAGPPAGAGEIHPAPPGSSAHGLGGDIVDAEFEDLPNAGER